MFSAPPFTPDAAGPLASPSSRVSEASIPARARARPLVSLFLVDIRRRAMLLGR